MNGKTMIFLSLIVYHVNVHNHYIFELLRYKIQNQKFILPNCRGVPPIFHMGHFYLYLCIFGSLFRRARCFYLVSPRVSKNALVSVLYLSVSLCIYNIINNSMIYAIVVTNDDNEQLYLERFIFLYIINELRQYQCCI